MKTLLTSLIILVTSVVSPVFGNEPMSRPSSDKLTESSKTDKPTESSKQNYQPKNNAEMVQAIKQKLEKSWELELLVGISNSDKYKLRVQIKVNSDGFVVGKIKPVDPLEPKGNYLLAFELAEKAIMRANPLPIVPNKFPNGLVLEITFDPYTGFSF